MKKHQYAKIEEGFFNFVTDYVNQPKADLIQPKIDAIQPYLVPKGVIVIWSGAANNVPRAWALCDGTNGTPDLRGRFVLGGIAGTGFNSIGNKAGVTDITLQPFNLPPHTHSGSVSVSGETNTTGNHTHNYTYKERDMVQSGSSTPCWYGGSTQSTSAAGDHKHTVTASGTYKTNDGDQPTKGQSFSILPPYYALAYIMKL